MSQFDALMGRLDAALKQPRGISRTMAVAGVRADALALIAFGDDPSVFGLVAEMALQAEAQGFYRLPRPEVARDVPCPKCQGKGIFVWGSGEGECFDCGGSGLVTRRQAEYRSAHVPPVILRERSGITPFGAAPVADAASPEPSADDIPF